MSNKPKEDKVVARVDENGKKWVNIMGKVLAKKKKVSDVKEADVLRWSLTVCAGIIKMIMEAEEKGLPLQVITIDTKLLFEPL